MVRGNSDRAYRVQVLGTDSQWVETSDQVLPPCHHHGCTVLPPGWREDGLLLLPQSGRRHGAGALHRGQGRLQGAGEQGRARPRHLRSSLQSLTCHLYLYITQYPALVEGIKIAAGSTVLLNI